jgi:Tol biopolymer transport system component
VSGGRLRKIDAAGGSPITLANKASNLGLAWNADDVILFSPDGGALFRVAASGGTPIQVTTPSRTSGEIGHWNPFFLPDGRHFLYVGVSGAATAGETGAQGIYIGSLDPMEKARMLVQSGGANPKYASGRLLFLRDATLMAQSFDADRLDLTGEAAPLAEQIEIGGATGTNGAFSVSQTGVLVYQAGLGDIRSEITWYDRAGKQIGTLGEPADQMGLELSPDGSRATISVLDPASASKNRDIWIYDVSRGLRTRFTFDPGMEIHSTWSPDGTTIAFDSRRQTRFDIYRKTASGAGIDELLLKDDLNKVVEAWSQDGRLLSYSRTGDSKTGNDIWTMSFATGAKTVPFLQTPFSEGRSRFSPDGRWLAYSSNESGRNEVYVTAFPGPGGKWQISTAGGQWPRWRRDGKEIFYLSLDNKLVAVDVASTAQGFTVGSARSLFETRPRITAFGGISAYPYDVTADGQRFLVNTLVEEASPEPITLLLNWPALLQK